MASPGGGDGEGDRENPVLEPNLEVLEPAFQGSHLVPVSPAAAPRDPPLDLAQGQHGDVHPVGRRGGDPFGDAHGRLALARLRQHVGVEQVGHALASRSPAFPRSMGRSRSVLRSASISAKTSIILSSTFGPPSKTSVRFTAARVRRWNSLTSMTTAMSSPWRVMTCGPWLVTARIISLKRCLASWICQ